MTTEAEMKINLELARNYRMEKGMFAVEINTDDGKGWEIAQGPMPRAAAREQAKWYRTHTDPVPRVRVVPTGKIVERDA